MIIITLTFFLLTYLSTIIPSNFLVKNYEIGTEILVRLIGCSSILHKYFRIKILF